MPIERHKLSCEIVPGSGPILLMVHGFLSSRAQWQVNLAALAKKTRPVLLELWGHGLSPTPENDEAYTIDAYIEQFELARIASGVSQVVMVGQSFAAGLGLHYARRHPDRVTGVVITNSMSAMARPESTEQKASRDQMTAQIELRGIAAIRDLPMHPRHARRIPTELREKLIEAADSVQPEAIIRALRMTVPFLSTRSELAHVMCPVLLVNGVLEKAFQPLRDHAVCTLPNCAVVDLMAGHAVNIEAAGGFNTAVLQFVEDLPTECFN
jgi:pimeloyl-ACP methyl ester carboxylesterase